MAEAFTRRLNDSDALGFAADVFSNRGDHARAIPLRRRLTELNPESAQHELELGDEQSQAFVGSGREHALLLRALGRLPVLLDGDNYDRMKFFDALQLLAAGDARRGRGMLGEVLRSDVWPYALAARIELERLDQTG